MENPIDQGARIRDLRNELRRLARQEGEERERVHRRGALLVIVEVDINVAKVSAATPGSTCARPQGLLASIDLRIGRPGHGHANRRSQRCVPMGLGASW